MLPDTAEEFLEVVPLPPLWYRSLWNHVFAWRWSPGQQATSSLSIRSIRVHDDLHWTIPPSMVSLDQVAVSHLRQKVQLFMVVLLADKHLQTLQSRAWLGPTRRFAEWRFGCGLWRLASQ